MRHIIILLVTLTLLGTFATSICIIYTTHIREFMFLTIGIAVFGFFWFRYIENYLLEDNG